MSDYNNGNQGRWTQGPGGQNQYPGGPGAPDPMRQDQPRPRNGYATVSMICGIFGILCLCCFAFPLAAAAAGPVSADGVGPERLQASGRAPAAYQPGSCSRISMPFAASR